MRTLLRLMTRLLAAIAAVAVIAAPYVLAIGWLGIEIPDLSRRNDPGFYSDTLPDVLMIAALMFWTFGWLQPLVEALTTPAPQADYPTRRPAQTRVETKIDHAAVNKKAEEGSRTRFYRWLLTGVAGAATLTSAVTSTISAAGPLTAPVPVTDVDVADSGTDDPVDGSVDDSREQPSGTWVTAQRRDTAYSIAAGIDPERAEALRDEIVALNHDRVLPDGTRYTSGEFPAGFDVLVPTATSDDQADVDDGGVEYTVHTARDGDSYWKIAEELLVLGQGGGTVTGSQVFAVVDVLRDHNADRLGYDNPDVLLKGDAVWIPIVTDVDNAPDTATDVVEIVVDVAEVVEVGDGASFVGPNGVEYSTLTAQDGDGYWDIAERHLVAIHGAGNVTDADVLELVPVLIEHNAERFGYDNPEMIHLNDAVWIPVAATTASAPTTVVDDVDATVPADAVSVDETAHQEPPGTNDEAADTAELLTEPPAVSSNTSSGGVEVPNSAAPGAGRVNAPEASPSESESPAVPSAMLAAGGVTVAAGLIALIERARRRRGRNIVAAAPEPEDVRNGVALRGQAARSHQDLAERITALVSEAYRDDTLPRSCLLQLIEISDDGRVQVTFDEPAAAVDPWQNVDPHSWATTVEDLDATDPDPDAEPVLSTVVSLGRTSISELFADLESLGSITISGDGAVDWMRGLRHQAGFAYCEVFADPVIEGLGTDDDTDVSHSMRDATADRVVLRDMIDAETVHSSIDARARRQVSSDELYPAVVFDPNGAATADEIASALPGGGVVLLTTAPGGSCEWSVDSDGTFQYHDLEASASVLPAETVDAARRLIEQPDIDDLDVEPAEAPAPMMVVDANDPPPRYEPAGAEAAYLIRVMRPTIDVVDTATSEPLNFTPTGQRGGRRAAELLTFLNQEPHGRASLDNVRDALWPPTDDNDRRVADSTVNALYYAARKAAQTELLDRANQMWVLNRDLVATDVDRLQHCYEFVRTYPSQWQHLHAALELIEGRPMDASDLHAWAAESHYLVRVANTITDAAELAAHIAIENGQFDAADWALKQGLKANPIDEPLIAALHDLDGRRGRTSAIRTRQATLVEQLRKNFDADPSPEVMEAFNRAVS